MDNIKNFFKHPIFVMISKILSWTAITLLVSIALFLVYYVVTVNLYAKKGEQYKPAISLYTIISPSMEPNIKVYDVVFDTKVKDPSKIKVGDIITFISSSSLSDGMTLTHRVVGVVETSDGYKFRTKGDNNSVADSSLVDSTKIIGKVAFKIPQLGRIQFLLQSKGGLLFALLIPAFGVVIYDVIKVIRLSDVQQKVNKSLTKEETEEEKLLKEKNAELKEKLQNKFVQIEQRESIFAPIITSSDLEDANKNKDTIEQAEEMNKYKDIIKQAEEVNNNIISNKEDIVPLNNEISETIVSNEENEIVNNEQEQLNKVESPKVNNNNNNKKNHNYHRNKYNKYNKYRRYNHKNKYYKKHNDVNLDKIMKNIEDLNNNSNINDLPKIKKD